MMPLALFASKSFVGLTLLTLFLYGALGGLFVLIPYVLIEEAHYPATAAGAALLPLPLVLAVASPMIGSLSERIGPRLPLTIGPLVVAAGIPAHFEDRRTGGLLDGVSAGDPDHSAWAQRRCCAANDEPCWNSVDAPTRLASGFNSAVARTGGLVATALRGLVLAAQGAELVSAFQVAMIASAVTCLAAAASGLILITGESWQNPELNDIAPDLPRSCRQSRDAPKQPTH